MLVKRRLSSPTFLQCYKHFKQQIQHGFSFDNSFFPIFLNSSKWLLNSSINSNIYPNSGIYWEGRKCIFALTPLEIYASGRICINFIYFNSFLRHLLSCDTSDIRLTTKQHHCCIFSFF